MAHTAPRIALLSGTILVVLLIVMVGVVVSWDANVDSIRANADERMSMTFEYRVGSSSETYPDVLHSDFIEATINDVPNGFGNEVRWVRLVVRNPTQQVIQYRLVFDNPILDRLDIYHRDPRFNALEQVSFGEQVDGLSTYLRAFPNLSFELTPDQTKQFWVRIENDGARLLSFNVLHEAGFEQYERLMHLVWGTFIGISLVLAMYNTVLYIGLRDTTYLYYVAYLVSVFLMFGAAHGFGYYLLPLPVQQFLSREIVFVQFLLALTSLSFSAAFLRIDASVGGLYRIKQQFSVVLIVVALLSIPMSEHRSAPFFALAQAIVYLLIVAMISYKFKERFHWTRYYLISWVPFLVGAAIGMMLFTGVVPYSYESRYAFMFAVIFEMTLISMALADRMGVTEKERLFHATHDIKTGLANDFYIEETLAKIQTQERSRTIALVAVKFTNYDYVISYLSVENQKLLMTNMAASFADQIQQQAGLLFLDEQNQVVTSVIHNHMFSFLVQLKNEKQLSNLMNSLSHQDNFNPVPEIIPFRVQCVLAGRLLKSGDPEPRILINSIKQCLNISQEQNSPYVIYHPELDHSTARGIRLAQDLEVAIAEDRLSLFYQPQKHLQSEGTCYSEVLVRWTHPELGFISPVEFVAIAEETGLIKKLTAWVIACAFQQQPVIAQRCENGVHISINVSANEQSAGWLASSEQCRIGVAGDLAG